MKQENGLKIKEEFTMSKWKKVLAVTLSITMAASMAACGKKDGGSPAAGGADEKKQVTLNTVSMFGGTDPAAATYQEINKQFQTDYSYITISDQSQASDQEWKAKIAADFAVGNEPDVIQFFTDRQAEAVLESDKFVTIEEIRKAYPDYAKDTLEAALAAAANPDGVMRAVPTTGYWEGLFCNKDLFDQYNLELPTNWNNFIKAIEVFQKNDIIPIAVSLNHVPHYWIEFFMLYAAGPESYTSVPAEAPEGWVKGLEMFKTLRDMGAFPEDTDTVDNDYIGELFRNKQAAMQLDGNWFANSITDENTVVVRFPKFDGAVAEEGSMIGGISSGFYITKKAWNDPDKRDAAVKFVMAHVNKDSVRKYWNGIGQAACVVEPVENMSPVALSGLEYANNITGIYAPTDSRISQQAYTTLCKGIVAVSLGEKSARELINEILAINAEQ